MCKGFLALATRKGNSISGTEVCVYVKEFCLVRIRKELNTYTSRKEGKVSTLGVIFLKRCFNTGSEKKLEVIYREC